MQTFLRKTTAQTRTNTISLPSRRPDSAMVRVQPGEIRVRLDRVVPGLQKAVASILNLRSIADRVERYADAVVWPAVVASAAILLRVFVRSLLTGRC